MPIEVGTNKLTNLTGNFMSNLKWYSEYCALRGWWIVIKDGFVYSHYPSKYQADLKRDELNESNTSN